jgi:hypothetical protein
VLYSHFRCQGRLVEVFPHALRFSGVPRLFGSSRSVPCTDYEIPDVDTLRSAGGNANEIQIMEFEMVFITVLLIQASIMVDYILLASTLYFKPIPLVQEFKEGFPMRRIVGCSLVSSGVFGSYQISYIAACS